MWAFRWCSNIHILNCAVKFRNMVLKIVKAVWFLSLLAVTAVLLYTYASLPENVTLREADPTLILARESFFYFVMVLLALINALAIVARRVFQPSASAFLVWLHALLIALNIFLAIALSYINVYNSLEKFDYERLGVVVYGSVWLIVLCALAWPAYLIFRNFFAKEAV